MVTHEPTFAKIGLIFYFVSFNTKGHETLKPTIDPQKMIPRKNKCDCWNQRSRKPQDTKQTSDKNFDVTFEFGTFERHYKSYAICI